MNLSGAVNISLLQELGALGGLAFHKYVAPHGAKKICHSERSEKVSWSADLVCPTRAARDRKFRAGSGDQFKTNLLEIDVR